MSLDELYQELLLDHFKHPRCQGSCANCNSSVELHNPLCGDKLKFSAVFEGQTLSDIKFTGSGCSISQATASLLSELVVGKSRSEVAQLATLYRNMMRSQISEEELDKLGDVAALQGVKRFTARIKCALLACDCIERLLHDTESVPPTAISS